MTQVWVNNEHVGNIDLLCQEGYVRGVYVHPSPRSVVVQIPVQDVQINSNAVSDAMADAARRLQVPNNIEWSAPAVLLEHDALRYVGTWNVFELAIESYHTLFDDPRFKPV